MRTHLKILAAFASILPAPVAAQDSPPPIDNSILLYVSSADSVKLPDGRQLRFVCMGDGSPTVILTAGLGGDAIDWRTVQPEIARTTRACAWDRPGFALSDGSTQPQTVLTTTADLEAALASGSITGPYVLVGHSLGSYESLLFADRHGDAVAGMVLVDPSFPGQGKVARRVMATTSAQSVDRGRASIAFLRKCAAALRSGSVRPGGADPDGCFAYPAIYPAAFRQALDAKIVNPIQYETLASFLENSEIAGELVVNPARNYGDMPLIVLTATNEISRPDMTDEQRAEQAAFDLEWNRAHVGLAALSSRGINARVPGAGHYVQRDKPQVVIDAVEAVVAEARTAGN